MFSYISLTKQWPGGRDSRDWAAEEPHQSLTFRAATAWKGSSRLLLSLGKRRAGHPGYGSCREMACLRMPLSSTNSKLQVESPGL
jgi:hypothetical protein